MVNNIGRGALVGRGILVWSAIGRCWIRHWIFKGMGMGVGEEVGNGVKGAFELFGGFFDASGNNGLGSVVPQFEPVWVGVTKACFNG